MGLADIFKPRSATNPAAYVPKAKMPTNQLASPRYTNVINNLEQNFKSPSARGASGGGGGAFKQAAGVLKKGGAVAAFTAGFLAADFLFNPQGKGISDDTNAAKGKPNPYLNGTKPFSGLNPGTPTYEPAVPFYGGQEEGILYDVTVQTVDYCNREKCGGSPNIKNHLVKNVPGPIKGTEILHRSFRGGGGGDIHYEVFFYLQYGKIGTNFYGCGTPCDEKNKEGFKAYITGISRVDGQPDTGGNPPPTGEAPKEGPSPPGLLMSPRPAPPVTPETPSAPSRPKAPPRPLNNPDKSAPPAPSPDPNTPQPNPAPSPTPAPVPQTNPTSREFWSPKPSQVTPSSGVGPAPITPVAPTPAQITPSTGVGPAPPAPAPAPTQDPTIAAPTKDPSKRTTPEAPPKPPTSEPPQKTIEEQLREQLKDATDRLNQLGLGIALITPIIQGIASNTTQDALETAAAAGTCRTTQPGGCTSNLVNGAADNINKNTNDKIDKLSAADTVIDADTNLRVRNIEDKTGSNEFPMLLPEYLMEDSLDVQVTINNQVQFNAWLLKNLSALLGMFPIKIEKENENGTKEIIKFDNVAETLAEFVGIYSKIAFDADTAVNVGIRSTAEAIGARIAGLQAGSYLKAIIDYLGFQTQPEPFPVKISCTIGAVGADGNLQETELDDFLKPSIQNVVGLDCKEQDDLHTIIKRILFDGEIARAALYKPLKPDKINNNLSITGDGIKAHRKKEEEKIDKKWEEFKSKIEGQTNLPFKVDIDEKGNNTTT